METNFQKYKAFLSAAETGSITSAANRLGYTQSAVSRMIADLEETLGMCLFERAKSGVTLTSDGKAFLPYVKKLMYDCDKLDEYVLSVKGINRGIIRIGTFSSVAAHWLPNIIRAFRKDYPEIEYELLLGDYSEIETWIEEGRADFGFLRLPSEGNFESIFLEDDRLCAVIPKNHRLAKSAVFPIEELCKEPFMLLEKDNNTDISALLEKYSLKPDIKFTTWDDYAIMSMVECGLGISVLPELILKRIPYDICVKPLSIPAYRKIGIAFKSKKTLSAAAKEFLKYLDLRNG